MPVGNDYCQLASVFYYDSEEQLMATPLPLVQRIEKHNLQYERLCLGRKNTLR